MPGRRPSLVFRRTPRVYPRKADAASRATTRAGLAIWGAPSVPPQGQHDREGDQHRGGDRQALHRLDARLLDEQVVDVADGLELAADALLPAAEVEPGRGEVEDPREVLVADQLQGVVGPLEQAGRLDL